MIRLQYKSGHYWQASPLKDQLRPEMALTISGTKFEVVPSVKPVLGLEIDSELSFNSHVAKLCAKLSQRIRILKRYDLVCP